MLPRWPVELPYIVIQILKKVGEMALNILIRPRTPQGIKIKIRLLCFVYKTNW